MCLRVAYVTTHNSMVLMVLFQQYIEYHKTGFDKNLTRIFPCKLFFLQSFAYHEINQLTPLLLSSSSASQRSNTTKLETAEFTEVDFDANLLVPECEIQDPSGHHRNASDNDNSSRCQGHRIKDATSSSSSDKLAIGDDAAVEVR